LRTHQALDERSLALHRLIAEKIRQNPALIERVRHTLNRWRVQVDAASQPYLKQWEALLDQGTEACLSVCLERSQNANALRQSSPFCGVLTAKERFHFLKTWQSGDETPRA